MTEKELKAKEEELKQKEMELAKKEEKRALLEKLDRIERDLRAYEAYLYSCSYSRSRSKRDSLFGEFVETITYPFKGVF
ncbi:hypothetical protein [Parasutterella muris]|uniref:hypothetical protein n=1 Tax=Parasutterella muris TaxID=2565572 RepID=UPI00203C9D4F|nr:hypothetical protein [Parasutterella muris]